MFARALRRIGVVAAIATVGVLGNGAAAFAWTTTSTSTCPSGTAAVTDWSYSAVGTDGVTRTFNHLANHTMPGDKITVTFTVAAGCQFQGVGFASYASPVTTKPFDPATADQQRLFSFQNWIFGEGTHSLTIFVPQPKTICDCHHIQ